MREHLRSRFVVHTQAAIFVLCAATAGCSGDTGVPGAVGPHGDTGDTGPQGDTGDTGPQGDTGDTGAKGEPGEIGLQGDTGDRGERGETGDKGATGATGETGSDGNAGGIGPMGLPGESGIIDRSQLTGNTMVYALDAMNGSGVTGVVRFAELEGGATLVTVVLDLVADLGIHPSELHFNSLASGGAPARTLNSIDGITGMSETLVSALDDGTMITYAELVDYNGYVNVHDSPMNDSVISAGDIGSNVLTGESVTYVLMEMSSSGITGMVTFQKRVNGFSRAAIEATGTLSADAPGHIHVGATGTGGEHIFTFTPVRRTDNTSVSDLRLLDDGVTPFGFEELLTFDGSVMLHMSAGDGTMIAGGNIGSNAFDDTNTPAVVVALAEVGSSGISGTATIHALAGGAAVVIVDLSGTTSGAMYPVGVFDTTPELQIALSSVTGGPATTGTSATAPDPGVASFAALSALTGTISVMTSPTDSTVVAEGTIN